jgi:hypothetical protein
MIQLRDEVIKRETDVLVDQLLGDLLCTVKNEQQ